MKSIVQFSGGRDSIALLYLMEPFWDGLTFVWQDAGDASPDLIALMDQVEDTVRLVRLHGRVKRDRADKGDPVGQEWMLCCSRNIWLPMDTFIQRMGIKWVIRGSKACDPINIIAPNHVDERGVAYMMPLWDWSEQKVGEYIEGRALKPVYPHDCATCPVAKPCDRPELVRVAA